ncbi:uncharacterized protein LOC127837640 [Dreissena polymorpha]|uniref:Mab-21-like HhH/H2TH-like domain-containing protein n=1 Tax=Dreissena polymorpha TaxID=45954 RepID=A0A9D4J3D7_DREPO|nr:uncharacterized protein LOC127837640 [Dreissena polymorpha]KAH3794328.1 hypothetical protein DPMN_147859 [Dreissena polymorpha]
MDALSIADIPENRVNQWEIILKFVHSVLEMCNAMAHKCDPHDVCNAQSPKSFSNVAEGVTNAGKKVADLLRYFNDDKVDSKMRNEIREPETKTDPIYGSSFCNETAIGETTELPKLMTADIVPAFTIQGWPRVAREWITRQRKWPQKETVMKIVQIGCQIVAKRPLFAELNGDRNNENHSPEVDGNDTCFRLSFSQCELALAKQLSEVPLLCWKILKAYQKAFLRTEPPVLTSYHWKTVLFWIREDTDDSFWSKGNLLNCVIKALDFMINCLEDRFLPVYFVREENLITGCRDDLVVKSLIKVSDIRREPSKFLSMFLKDPPKPDLYIISKEKINEYLSTECQQNIVEDICDDLMYGLWTSLPFSTTEDGIQFNGERYDSHRRRIPYVFRNWMQLIKSETVCDADTRLKQLILTGVDSFTENVLTFIKDENSAEADVEIEQVIYSRQQDTKLTKAPESQVWDMPAMATIQKDHTRLTNDSATADADPHNSEEIDEDQVSRVEDSAMSSYSPCQKVKTDDDHNERPQTEEILGDKSTHSDCQKKSTIQSPDSPRKSVNAFVEIRHELFQPVSEERDEENNDGECTSGVDFRSFARKFVRNFQNQLSEKNYYNHDNMTDPCKTSNPTRVLCSEYNVHDFEDIAEDKGFTLEASKTSSAKTYDALSPEVKKGVDPNKPPHISEESVGGKSSHAEDSTKFNTPSADILSRKMEAGVNLVNAFVRLVYDGENKDEEVRESGFFGFAGNFLRNCQTLLGEEKIDTCDNETDLCKDSKPTKAHCDFDLD